MLNLRVAREDRAQLEEGIKTFKNYNTVLKNTILKLKSPEYLDKYVNIGKQ